MIVWRGYGIWIFVIVGLVSFLTELAVEGALHNPIYYQYHAWPLSTALLVSAGLVALLHRWMTGRGMGDGHDFMFVPMRWWPVILALLALVPFGTRRLL